MMAPKLMFLCLILLLGVGPELALADGPFSAVSAESQKSRDDKRVSILKGELSQEKSEIEKAQRAVADLMARKVGGVELDEARENVKRHAQNVEAINREINLVTKSAGSGQAKVVVKAAAVVPEALPQEVPYWDTFRRGTGKDTVKAVVREAPDASANTSEEVPYWDTFRRKQPNPVRRD